MKRLLTALFLSLALVACEPPAEVPSPPAETTDVITPEDPVDVAPQADQSGAPATAGDAATDPADDHPGYGIEDVNLQESRINRRATFAGAGEDLVPFCAQALSDDGEPLPGVKVTIRELGSGELAEGVYTVEGDSLPVPVFETDDNGIVYFDLGSNVEANVFLRAYFEGRPSLAAPTGAVRFLAPAVADALNEPYPLALTDFPEGNCLEPATLDEE